MRSSIKQLWHVKIEELRSTTYKKLNYRVKKDLTMKAIGYFEPLPISNPESLLELDIPESTITNEDLLVEVKAVSVNPIDFKVRKTRKAKNNQPVILGWDAAGIVRDRGSKSNGFEIGDEVFYAGDLLRPGSNAQMQAINYRLVAKKPKNLNFSEAAALPLTSLTAYESLFEKLNIPQEENCNVLIIGGAGGVGSMAIQLLKQLTQATVFTTYGRSASLDWIQSLKADVLLDRNISLTDHVKTGALSLVEYIFSTTHTDQYLKDFPEVMTPFGQLCLIDDPQPFDIKIFKGKAMSLHWESMFAKSMFSYNMNSQGEILTKISQLVEANKIKTTAQHNLRGLKAENFKEAHRILESAESIGKITIEF